MTEDLYSILVLAAVVLIGIFVIRLLFKPIRFALKLLINTLFGFVILFIVNFFGDPIGLSLGVSWFNALVAGVLGVPGVILLLIIKFFV